MSTRINLIDVSSEGFIVEPRYYFYGWNKSPRILARTGLLKRLVLARSYLPDGYNFKIWDAQRSYNTQALMMESFRKRLQVTHPNANKKQLDKLVLIFAAPLLKKVERVDTHRHGGAVDLTIVNKHGEELYMGTDHDDLTDRATTDYFTIKKSLSVLDREAKKNRALLIRVLTKAGLKNYVHEWWHWSYGK